MKIDPVEVFRLSVDLFEGSRVEYFLIGGMAVGVWGNPRLTTDVDFIVALAPNAVGPFLVKARESGFEVDEQVVLMNLQISGVARFTYRGTFLDLIVGESDFDRSAMGRRRRLQLLSREAWVVSPEDLVLYKLVAMRDRDIDDVRRVLIRQGSSLDVAYLRNWAAILADKIGKPEIASKLNELLAEYEIGAPHA